MTDESGTFQNGDGEAYRDGTPSPKRSRYDSSGDIDSSEEGSVHLSMPQTQFEIEINSHHDAGSPTQDIEAHDLAGPTFAVIEEQDIQQLENATASNSSQFQSTTLSALNRALLQMKQPTQSSLLVTSITSCSEQQQPPSSNSPLYIMIPQPSSGTDMIHSLQSQARPIAPKLQSGDSDPIRQDRDQIRKATHNEVERRRRDRINELIKTLAQLVPGCQKKDASTGSIIGYVYSKGTVLDKTVDYLKELLLQNEQLTHGTRLAEKSAGTISALQSQIAALEKDNTLLRSQLMQFGLDIGNPQMTGPRSVPLAHALLQQCTPQATYIPTSSVGNQMVTNQLLASLAQNLASSNSSLLSSVAQQVQLPSSSIAQQVQLPSSSMFSSVGQQVQLPSSSVGQQLYSSQLTPTPPNAYPQIPQLGALHTSAVNQSVPLINLLVQTLASFANPAPVQATSLPRIAVPQFHPQFANQSNLSAAAAATLLNTILVANMLGGGGAPSPHNDSGSGTISSSVLNSINHQANQETKK